MSENRPATWLNPETGEVWVLPRRYAPPHWKRVDELCAQCGRPAAGWHCRCREGAGR
jgi:hypothetical protein